MFSIHINNSNFDFLQSNAAKKLDDLVFYGFSQRKSGFLCHFKYQYSIEVYTLCNNCSLQTSSDFGPNCNFMTPLRSYKSHVVSFKYSLSVYSVYLNICRAFFTSLRTVSLLIILSCASGKGILFFALTSMEICRNWESSFDRA